MNRLEYRLSSAFLRVARFFFSRLRVRPRRIVLATARVPTLDGNLLHIHGALRRLHPEIEPVLLLEPYRYGLRGKIGYLLRLVRGMYYLQTARLFIVDNAYLPIHVAPHRSATTVVQVWHAAGALKRFGVDTRTPLAEPEATFLHRYYDWVVCSAERPTEWRLAHREGTEVEPTAGRRGFSCPSPCRPPDPEAPEKDGGRQGRAGPPCRHR